MAALPSIDYPMKTTTHLCCELASAGVVVRGAVSSITWSICPRPMGRAGNPRRASVGAAANVVFAAAI